GTVALQGVLPNAVQYLALKETSTPAPSTDWVKYGYSDGADGFGFRTRWDPTSKTGGKIYPSYLQQGKFKLHGMSSLDSSGFPIMYFPANPAKINLAVNTGPDAGYYVSSLGVPLVPGGGRCVYDFDNNGTLAISMSADPVPVTVKTLARMQVMM